MSEETLIRHCSPTLAGLKTGNLFSCEFESKTAMYSEIRNFNHLLNGKGLRILPLRWHRNRALIYVYRPEKLKQDFHCCEVCRILKEQGYENFSQNRCLAELISRLRNTEEFPHEIGLFLGYPPEDVTGFIRKQKCQYTGYWKVYHNPAQARKLFAQFRRCTEFYLREYHSGRPLEQLAADGVKNF